MENAPTLQLGSFRMRKVGPIGTALLMAVVVAPLAWIILNSDWHVFRWGFVMSVVSGQIFRDLFEPFDIHCAGFSLDQPTIGKWLFWFTVFTILTVPYLTIVRWISDRSTRWGRLAFNVPLIAWGVLLLELLIPPLFLLIQYMISMGITPRRIEGVIYTIVSGLSMLAYIWWATRRP